MFKTGDFSGMKPSSLLAKLIAAAAFAAAAGAIAFTVYVLALRTDYKETALEINDAILAAGKQAAISRGGETFKASGDVTDYYNRFLLDTYTQVYSRKSTQKTDDTITIELGENSLSYTGLEDGTAIGICWETPEKRKDFRVRSLTTFMQLGAFFDNYSRKEAAAGQ